MPDQEPDFYSRNQAWAKPGSYVTKLLPAEEQMFQAWVFKNKIPFDAGQKSPQDYDMRGFFRAMLAGDPIAAQDPGTLHFPDKWKTPYHETFSNESMYAKPDAPRWKGDNLVDKAGKVIWSPPSQ